MSVLTEPVARAAATAGTMRAFVIAGVGRTAVVEKPIPVPGPDEAVVRTTAALICTSDVHTVRGAIPVPAGHRRRETGAVRAGLRQPQRSGHY